jgi:hypothetical protein
MAVHASVGEMESGVASLTSKRADAIAKQNGTMSYHPVTPMKSDTV